MTRSPELRGKLGATLAATSRDDCTTGAGAHTGTETVHLSAAAVVGLEGTLAHSSDSVTLWYESPGFTTQGKSAFGQARKELLPIQGTYFTPIFITRQSRPFLELHTGRCQPVDNVRVNALNSRQWLHLAVDNLARIAPVNDQEEVDV